MLKLKVTKGEAKVLNIMQAASVDAMKGGQPVTQKDFASVTKKIRDLLALDNSPKVKKAKPLSKKAIREILKQVLPKEAITDKGDFLVKLQQNINTAFN
jgi:hypothetical protein